MKREIGNYTKYSALRYGFVSGFEADEDTRKHPCKKKHFNKHYKSTTIKIIS